MDFVEDTKAERLGIAHPQNFEVVEGDSLY